MPGQQMMGDGGVQNAHLSSSLLFGLDERENCLV